MKKAAIFCILLLVGYLGKAQTVTGSLFALNTTDAFSYSGINMPNYGMGWFSDPWNNVGATHWLSGFGGIKLFTGGKSRVVLDGNGLMGVGINTPGARLSLYNEVNAAAVPVLRINAGTGGAPQAGGAVEFYTGQEGSPMGRVYTKNNFSSGVGNSNGALVLSSYANAYKDELTLLNGNVGVGTSNPINRLQIGNFQTSSTNSIVIPGNYNFEQVKLGQTNGNGASALEFVNHTSATNSFGIRMLVNSDQFYGFQLQYTPEASSYNALSYTTGLSMDINGNVLIGKINQTNSSYKLDVNGTIRANKVVVNTTGADFVFDSAYQLTPLPEVEQYIQQHKHLPGIAPAADMQQNGAELGEYQTKLLQKTEELTLYMIEQEKQLKQQKELLQQQQDMIRLLQQQVEALKKKRQ